MRDKKAGFLLLMEAAACMLFCLLQVRFSNIFSRAAAFPFEQIGWILRLLSLSGAAGNAAAVALYILLGLAPLLAGGVLYAKGKGNKADLLLAGLSILLFFILYYMINPGRLRMAVPESGKWVCGAVFYSAFFGYLVLRTLVVSVSSDRKRLYKGLLRLLWLLAALFVYAAFGGCFGALLSSMQTLQGAGEAVEYGVTMPQISSLSMSLSRLFLILQFLTDALPYILDIRIIFLAVNMVRESEADRYSDRAVLAVARLADFCVRALAVSTVVSVAFHILQFAFGRRLYQVNIQIVIPVASVLFVFVVLLLARYVQEDQKLKQEHDLII